MPKPDRNLSRILVNTAIFIAMEVAALHFLANSGAVQETWLGQLSQGFREYVWGKTESVKLYFSLDEQNRLLSEENIRLRAALGLRTDAEATAELDSLLGTLPDSRFGYISATIVKISDNREHNYLIIDKGERDGVAPGDGIVTSRGVVGIVESTTPRRAAAISMKNRQMSISARIGRDGASGPLSWDGRSSHGALLRDIPLQNRFSAGDTVFTSAHSSIFPAGIPVGVTEDARIVNGATYEIRVTLFQDFSTLQYVSVVKNLAKEEIRQLEEGGARQ